MISASKSSCFNSRLKQGEMCKSMEYENTNIFILIGALTISIFVSGTRKHLWSLIIKPTINNSKTTPKRINQLWMERLWCCSWFKGFTYKNIFTVTGKSANNVAIMLRLLGQPYRQSNIGPNFPKLWPGSRLIAHYYS